MINCPNCNQDNSIVTKREDHYDHSFTCLKCNSCGKDWAIGYDCDGNAVDVQIQREDGKNYVYDLQGNLIWVC